MTSINCIIQGPEDHLHERVLNELILCGCSPKYIREYESHKRDPIEKLIGISEEFLLAIGCWRER